MSRLRGLLVGDAVSPETWAEVEESLIAGDVGAALATDGRRPGARARRERRRRARPSAASSRRSCSRATRAGTCRAAGPRRSRRSSSIVGVNGTGKTTTIGKLAAREAAAGRTGPPRRRRHVPRRGRRAAPDLGRPRRRRHRRPRRRAPIPAAVVYDALDAAVARRADVVIIDTAGRLHTKSNLMDELAKIRRVIDRRLPGAQPGDAPRPRCDDRPERPRPGRRVPRGRRPDRDRAHQARLDAARRHRLRHRATARRPGALRRGGGAAGGPPRLRPGGVRRRALRGRRVTGPTPRTPGARPRSSLAHRRRSPAASATRAASAAPTPTRAPEPTPMTTTYELGDDRLVRGPRAPLRPRDRDPRRPRRAGRGHRSASRTRRAEVRRARRRDPARRRRDADRADARIDVPRRCPAEGSVGAVLTYELQGIAVRRRRGPPDRRRPRCTSRSVPARRRRRRGRGLRARRPRR